MKENQNPNPINWRKFFWVGAILLVVGYAYAHPTLEKWTGLELPALMEEEPNRDAERERGVNVTPIEEPQNQTPAKVERESSSDKFELKELNRNKYESPEGLIYAMGPRGEHRIDHILRHAKDNQSRPVHSVFEGDKDLILRTIDEAYALIKASSNRVRSSREGNRIEYTVDMKRRIGFEGGQKGKRNNFPQLKRLKLILQNENYVVTAYPYR